MGPYQRTPTEVARAIRYSGLGVRSVGPVGDVLDMWKLPLFSRYAFCFLKAPQNLKPNILNTFHWCKWTICGRFKTWTCSNVPTMPFSTHLKSNILPMDKILHHLNTVQFLSVKKVMFLHVKLVTAK